MKTLALLLLVAAVGPGEETYGPYIRPTRGETHAMAVAHNRVLLAWSEIDPVTNRARIRIALLDSRGRRVGSITAFPATRATADAVAPSVATDGERFFVAWLEYDRVQQTMGVVVDASGAPIGTPRPYGPEQVISVQPSLPYVVWDGTSYQLWGSLSQLWGSVSAHILTPDGEIRPGERPVGRPSAVGSAHTFGYVGTKVTPIYTGCWLFRCQKIGERYDVVWAAGAESGTHDAGSLPISPVSMTPAGERFAVAWTGHLSVSFLLTGGTFHSIWAQPDMSVAPGIACDATDCVLAYGTASGDVQAVTFPIDQPHQTSMFTVAASERQEGAPQVHAIRDGRFLVTYRSDQGTARLAGRVVTLGESKRRAVR